MLAEGLQDYLQRLNATDDPILGAMHDRARRDGFPIIGPQVGRLVHLLARSIGAHTVVELGSGFGYSAHWFASAVGPRGTVHLTDWSQDRLDSAQTHLEEAGLWDRCVAHCGDALELFEAFEGVADVVFMDVDKDAYPKVVDLLDRRLRIGGLLIVDNTLWQGRVYGLDEDPSTQGIRELTQLLWNDSRFTCSLIPLRDGVTIALRTG